MKTNRILTRIATLLLLSTVNYQLSAWAQTPAFTYQGRLNVSSNVASGLYDMTFRLYNATNGTLLLGPVTNSAVAVSNGLFTTTVNFGSVGIFVGLDESLEIAVRTNGGGAFATLSPRQPLTPTPQAVYAISAGSVAGGGGAYVARAGDTMTGTLNLPANGLTIGGNQLVMNSTYLLDLLCPSTTQGIRMNRTGKTTQLYLTIADGDFGYLDLGQGTILRGGNGTYSSINGSVSIGNVVPTGKLTILTADDTTPSTINAFDIRHALVGSPTSGLALSYSTTLGAGYITALSPLVSWRDLVLQANDLSFRPLGGSPALTISNNYSVAMGYLTIASGQYSTALGGGSTASGQSAFAAGASAHANADFSVALGYVNTASGNYSTISGGQNNQATAVSSTVGGGDSNIAGGGDSTIAGGVINQTADSYSTVGGGVYNNALAQASTVAGGDLNQVLSGADFSDIGGGAGNAILTSATHATICGGYQNLISRRGPVGGFVFSPDSTISGGSSNIILGAGAVIGGGYTNYAVDNAVVPGGAFNYAGGTGSFAAGRSAHVTHSGSFMWSDGTATANSSGNNRFEVRSTGGANFNLGSANFTANGQFVVATGLGNEQAYIGGDGLGSDVQFGSLQSGVVNAVIYNAADQQTMNLTVNTLAITSDRNQKENFAPISAQEALAKVASLPISRWNFKNDSKTPHIGPMAQDFYAAFGVGADDKHIATVDEEGVALAAIQGLNQKLEEQVNANQAKDAEIQDLKHRLERLEESLSNSKIKH